MKFKDMTSHFDKECLEIEIRCPKNCKYSAIEETKLTRKNLSDHLNECPLQLVEGQLDGCFQKVPRNEVNIHLK